MNKIKERRELTKQNIECIKKYYEKLINTNELNLLINQIKKSEICMKE